MWELIYQFFNPSFRKILWERFLPLYPIYNVWLNIDLLVLLQHLELESSDPSSSAIWRWGLYLSDLPPPSIKRRLQAPGLPGHRQHHWQQGEGLQSQHGRDPRLSHQGHHPPSCLHILVCWLYDSDFIFFVSPIFTMKFCLKWSNFLRIRIILIKTFPN